MSQPPTPPSGGSDRPAEDAGRHETTPFQPPAPGAGETRQVQLPKLPPPQLRKQPPADQPEPTPTDPGGPAPYTGPPTYGQPQYRQPQYEQQQWGQPQYGQPQWGQPQWGQPQYGQPQYGQPGYGQQQWGQPGAPPPPRKGSQGRIIALVVAGVVVLAGIGVGLWFALGRGPGTTTASERLAPATTTAASPTTPSSSSEPTTGSTAGEETDGGNSGGGQGVPPAGKPPTGLGDNDALDLFAQQCYQGSMPSCDVLYFAAQSDPSLQPYADYAHTCAGRQPASSDRLCTEAFPG